MVDGAGGRRAARGFREPVRGPLLALGCAIALLLVAAATTAAVLADPGPSGGPGPRAAPPAFARPLAGPTRTVAAGGVRFAVPQAPAWSVSDPGTLVGFDRAEGTVLSGPAFLRRGWCPGDRRWSSRALVGVAPPAGRATRGPARRATRRAAAAWRKALAGGTGAGPRPIRVRRARLADGTPAWLATGRTPVPRDRARCAPPAVALSVLGVRTGGDVALVVALRDIGVPDALPASVVDRLLAGVRVAGAP